MSKIEFVEDLEFAVVAELEPEYQCSVHYRIYEIAAHSLDGKPLLQRKDSIVSPDPVETFEEAEIYISGSVKWDGCSNWKVEQEGYLHFCEPEQLANVGKILVHCWNMTAELMPKWDNAKQSKEPVD